MNCKKYFQNARRRSRIADTLLRLYAWGRYTVNQLAKKYKRSHNWVRERLEEAEIKRRPANPQPVVVVADSTFFRRDFVVCVFRDPHLKKNLHWQLTDTETSVVYKIARSNLEEQGFKILAIVLDAKPGLRKVFSDIPVQICHFHQKLIITRYLTNMPKLEAGRELKYLTSLLNQSNQEEFTILLNAWHARWLDFLKEKTIDLESGRWHFTHRRLRAAYRSLKTNLPFLFTYLKYPELNIPNTTNSLEGTFSHLKELVNIHRGLTLSMKIKIIEKILWG